MQDSKISVSSLNLFYGENHALKDINIKIRENTVMALIGPSGCGKSTLLSIIAGLRSPTAGEIRLAGDGSIGYMLQKDSLFPWRTIRRNVLLGAEIKGGGLRAAEEYADSLLKTYGLWEFRDCFPGQLSGGMRQRAALIRTLAVRPQLLLLDEAFSALDYQTRLAVADDIYSIIRREGKTAMMVTHDISEAVSLSDRVIVLTKRPAVIKSIYDIRFAAGRRSPLQCREEPEFRGYFNQIWRDIDVHV